MHGKDVALCKNCIATVALERVLEDHSAKRLDRLYHDLAKRYGASIGSRTMTGFEFRF